MNLWPFCSHFWPSPVPAFASKILNLHQVPNHRHGRFQTSTQDVAHHLEDGRKLNEACEFLGECLWEATPFCKVLRCSKLKGKLLSKKTDVTVKSSWYFVLAYAPSEQLPMNFHHRLNLEVCRAREKCPVNPTKSPYICVLWFPAKWVPFNDRW